MKKFLIFLMCLIGICVSDAYAESIVYLFAKAGNSMDYQVSCDGVNVCDLNGPTKKTMDGNGMFKIPYRVAHSCYRKLTFNKEGKVVITVNGDFTQCSNLKHILMKAEYQLDLEDGGIYYLDVKGKGLNDLQIKPLKEKDALKNMESEKWKELTPIIVE
ncbi:MAG: hypothetical protein ACI304_00305 [Lepagella sp.]